MHAKMLIGKGGLAKTVRQTAGSLTAVFLAALMLMFPGSASAEEQVIEEYRIEYVLNGPEGESWDAVTNAPENPDHYTAKDTVKLKKPVREGYTFGGWYKDQKFKKKIGTIKKGSRGDRTFYAKWTANKYTIVLKPNGGKGKTKKIRGKSSGELTLPDSGYTLKGHTLAGWNLTEEAIDGGYDYLPDAVFPAGSITGKDEQLVLYAQWENNEAKEYHVSPDGNDENDGSEENPFRTISHALEFSTPGSVIRIHAGTYDETLTFQRSGERTDPIVLCGDEVVKTGEEEWQLTCPSVLTSSREEDSVTLIDLNGQSNIRIENLDIGNISAKYACGIFIPQKCRNVTIRNCRIHGIKVAEPYLVSPEEEGENAGEANAILCFGDGKTKKKTISNIRILENEVCDNVTNWSESVSVAGNVSGARIIGNFVHDNTNIGIDLNGNTGYCKKASLDQPRSCIVSGNTVCNCHCEYAFCAGIYADGARSCRITDNTVHDCDYGIEIGAEIRKDKYPVKKITVSGNLLYDNYHGGIWIGGYDRKHAGLVKSTKILDNVLKDNHKGRESADDFCAEIVINRCEGITFQGNTIESSLPTEEAGPLIAGEMGKKYTSGLTFRKNTYRTALSGDEIGFLLWGKEIKGIAAFNKATRGNDQAEQILP